MARERREDDRQCGHFPKTGRDLFRRVGEQFGVVVDGVSDVVDVNNEEVKGAPDLGARGATDYIRGLVPVADRMVVLLDIDRLIGSDMAAFSSNSSGGSAGTAEPAPVAA